MPRGFCETYIDVDGGHPQYSHAQNPPRSGTTRAHDFQLVPSMCFVPGTHEERNSAGIQYRRPERSTIIHGHCGGHESRWSDHEGHVAYRTTISSSDFHIGRFQHDFLRIWCGFAILGRFSRVLDLLGGRGASYIDVPSGMVQMVCWRYRNLSWTHKEPYGRAKRCRMGYLKLSWLWCGKAIRIGAPIVGPWWELWDSPLTP